MQGQADSTTVTYSKLPSYLQPCNDSSIQSARYSLNNRVAVGYAAATTCVSQLRSSHHQRQNSPDEPHLSDYGITPSPSDSNSSRDDTKREPLFRPINFDSVSIGMCRSLVPLTPPESSTGSRSGSFDCGSSNEDELPDVLIVRIPRRPSMIVANNQPCNGPNDSCEPKLKPANASANGSADSSANVYLGLNCSGQASQPHHGITINLLDRDLWKMFESVGNEMIVTKPGRRLFPALLIGIRGLDIHTEYNISLRISSADPYRYKFHNMQWVSVGESEVMQNEDRQIFCHPNSPNTGQFWMKKPISFKQVKITHNPSSSCGNVLLHTMHRYVMEIVLEPAGQPSITIPIPDTEFMAVTAYQNTKITQLKIDNNPFAKGFRDRESVRFHHPSTMFPSPHSLPSLYSFPSGQTPLWHQMPQLACHIPSFLSINGAGGDVQRLQSSFPGLKESSQNQPTSDNLSRFPTYPHPAIPAPYPYIPPTTMSNP